MRREFSAKVRLAAYERCKINGKPHCEVRWNGKRCAKLILGIPEYDHIKPDGLQGEPTLENCQAACGACHKQKTHEIDRPIMAKADRTRKAAAGTRLKAKLRSRGFAPFVPNIKQIYEEFDHDT